MLFQKYDTATTDHCVTRFPRRQVSTSRTIPPAVSGVNVIYQQARKKKKDGHHEGMLAPFLGGSSR